MLDTSGEWWTGDNPADLCEYLQALTADSYPVTEFRLAVCACGGCEFLLEADKNEGTARRTCSGCDAVHFVCDSEEYWEDATPESWKCVGCGDNRTNVGVGFALYEDAEDIHWLYIGVRCATCGILGCFADWKIGYGPSLHLMDLV
jgi:hypothetical protein